MYIHKDISKQFKHYKTISNGTFMWFKTDEDHNYFLTPCGLNDNKNNIWMLYTFFITKRLEDGGIFIKRYYCDMMFGLVGIVKGFNECIEIFNQYKYVKCSEGFYNNILKLSELHKKMNIIKI